MRTRVFSKLSMPTMLRLEAQLVDGTTATENSTSVKLLICFVPSFNKTEAYKEASKLRGIANQVEIVVPMDLAEEKDAASAREAMEQIKKLEAKFPGASEQLGNVRKAIDISLVLYTNGQRYHKGKWLTAAAYKLVRGKAALERFNDTSFSDNTIKHLISSYKEAAAALAESTDLQRSLRTSALQKIKMIIAEYPAKMYTSIPETASQLGLAPHEKAELLLLVYNNPSTEYNLARSIITDLGSLVAQSPEARTVVEDWQKESAIVDKLSAQLNVIAMNMKEQAEKASSTSQLVKQINHTIAAIQPLAKDITAQLDSKRTSPHQTLLKSQAELLALVPELTSPAQTFTQGRIFSARNKLQTLQRKLARFSDSPLRESLSAVCQRIAVLGGDSNWYSRLLAQATAEAIR
ncbi:MAG TPA: hypothetical protein VK970_02745 [Candidatus Methylacidiphilales bacterium]|nr:hypothetical protein [Candidatus Methylacidiphilales bacterium]